LATVSTLIEGGTEASACGHQRLDALFGVDDVAPAAC